jgi:hypothetical protein
VEQKLQITLRAARVNANGGKGYTIIEAANLVGVGKEKIIEYERHSGTVPAYLMKTFSQVYGIPVDAIIFVS